MRPRHYNLMFIVVCIAAASPWAPAVSSTPRQYSGPLDVNAKIEVAVKGVPTAGGDYTVDGSGDVEMAQVGRLHVQGLTADQTRDAIAAKLIGVSSHPKVTVRVLSPGGIVVSVSGAVATAGPQTVSSSAHLDDALRLASPSLDANLDVVKLSHASPVQAAPAAGHLAIGFVPTESVVSVDFSAFLHGSTGGDAGNPSLRDGDSIFVERNPHVSIQVNVRGDVNQAGRVMLPGDATLVDAVKAAGGLSVDADSSHLAIQHSGSITQLPMDYAAAVQSPADPTLNPMLLDGDTLIVVAVNHNNSYTIAGAVAHPGEFTLTATALTLADAIAAAGGTLPRARLKDASIVRSDATGKAAKIPVNAADNAICKATILQAGDSVVIPYGSGPLHVDPMEAIGVAVTVIGAGHH